MFNIKWAYAMNQWNCTEECARREEIVRAFKVAAVCSCSAIELNAGSGRWAPITRPTLIDRSFESWEHFKTTLHDCALGDAAISWFYDPNGMYGEEGTHGRDTRDPAQADGIVEAVRAYADYLQKLGGKYIVAKPAGNYAAWGELTDGQMKAIGECWNKVGAMLKSYGLKLLLHTDWQCAVRTVEDIDRLMEATDSELVGLCIDTAECVFGGIDPIALYKKYISRVGLFHFKDVHTTAPADAYKDPLAELHLHSSLGRWFFPMGTDGGKVDFIGLVKAMKAAGYDGYVVLESHQAPNTAEAAMLNNYYIKKVLTKVV